MASSFPQVGLISPLSDRPPLSSNESRELHWYVAYTRPRHEKRVEQQMQHCGIDCFLPLYLSLRRWNDRSSPAMCLCTSRLPTAFASCSYRAYSNLSASKGALTF